MNSMINSIIFVDSCAIMSVSLDTSLENLHSLMIFRPYYLF